MMKKKGVSEIIATILIILLVLAAIIIVWQVVSGVINRGATTVDERSQCIEARLEFEEGSVICWNAGARVNATVTRGGDNVDTMGMIVIAGDNRTTYDDAPDSLGSMRIALTGVGSSLNAEVTVRVAPVVGTTEVICDPTDEFEVTCTA